MTPASAGPEWLGAVDAARSIRESRLDSETLVRACLDRIAGREPEVLAWAHLDADGALAQARARDAQAPIGLLHGVPIGVKDVIDVEGLPTACGSPIHAGSLARVDAACVALVRAAGAVILGKTHTAEFANTAPPPTRNPIAPSHTPGGSSSGSAAAVADAMVPLALGTQTVGSTIRPAAFCGIVGYKPSFGLINRAGLKFSAESFDTIGLMGRSVADVALLARVLAGVHPHGARDVRGLRIGLCLGAFRDAASVAARTALESSAVCLREAGAIVTEFEPAWADERLRDAHQTVMLHELARASLWEVQHHAGELSERFRLNIEKGLSIDTAQWQASRRQIADCRLRMAAQSQELDGVLTFAAPGEAPEGLGSTGDSVFNRIWTALAGPCLSLPAGRGEQGLPLAVQWVGFEGEDAAALAAAAAIEEVLAA